MLYDVLGGVGVYIDPIARFGVVVETAFHYHGDLAKVRIAGNRWNPPLPPQGQGWKLRSRWVCRRAGARLASQEALQPEAFGRLARCRS